LKNVEMLFLLFVCGTRSGLEIAAIISFKYYICYLLNALSKLIIIKGLTENITFHLKSANRNG